MSDIREHMSNPTTDVEAALERFRAAAGDGYMVDLSVHWDERTSVGDRYPVHGSRVTARALVETR